ncbi:MAG: PEP-CTERM sorting domain-containing protein, partial [Armatimonadota bacterium]
ANAGKWTGTGSGTPWYYVYDTATTTVDPKPLMINGVCWGSTGYAIPPAVYGNSGLSKDYCPQGVGVGRPQMVANNPETDGGWAWVAFRAPATGNYTYNFHCSYGSDPTSIEVVRVDYKTTKLVEDRVIATGNVDMRGGDYLYFRGSQGWPHVELLTVTMNADNSTGKDVQDGTEVNWTECAVTAVFPEGFYIEKNDRTMGIRVRGASVIPNIGDKVAVSGVMGTDANERVIVNPIVTPVTGSNYIKPLFMVNKSVGGANDGLITGVTGGVGVNNIGLLVKTTGKVVKKDTSTLWVDDGSDVPGRWKLASDTYGVGFKWTFWDPANTAHSDWVDMVKGRTAPLDPGYWAPNPAGDAASISDPANAGKWDGTGPGYVWSVVGSVNHPHSEDPLISFTTWMATQGYGWSAAGVWAVPNNAYGNSGLTKIDHSDGVGVGAPQFVERPADCPSPYENSVAWLAFTAPVAGDYNFICNAYAGVRLYKETELIGAADFTVNSTAHMDAGQKLYLRIMQNADCTGWAAADLVTVTGTNLVPEPSSMLALCCGIPVVLGGLIRRRKNS